MHSALRRAVERGNLQAVLAALEHGADIEEPDMHGDTGLPLRIACFKGHFEIVEELIRRGADIHAPNAQGIGGPIRMAARANHHAIVNLLILHGAELPADVQLKPEQHGERRKRSERRKRDTGAPPGFVERRRAAERRVTSVSELTLTDLQWQTYFTQSQPFPVIRSSHEIDETVSLIFGRIRD